MKLKKKNPRPKIIQEKRKFEKKIKSFIVIYYI
jgi:hypothetical protein